MIIIIILILTKLSRTLGDVEHSWALMVLLGACAYSTWARNNKEPDNKWKILKIHCAVFLINVLGLIFQAADIRTSCHKNYPQVFQNIGINSLLLKMVKSWYSISVTFFGFRKKELKYKNNFSSMVLKWDTRGFDY